MIAADIILGALRAAVPADVTVIDAIVTGVAPAKYVIVFIPPGHRTATAVTAVSDGVDVRFSTMVVASNTNPAYAAALCRWLSALVRDTLTDLSVTADGWGRTLIRHEGGQAPRVDETTPDKKVYATDQFSLTTVRIP